MQIRTDQLVLYLLLSAVAVAEGAEGDRSYIICGGSKSGHAIAVPRDVHCVSPELDILHDVRVEVWVPRSTPLRTTAFKCQIHRQEVCTFVSFFTARSNLPPTTNVWAVEFNVCKHAIEKKVWDDKPLVAKSPGLWTTNEVANVSYYWCCKYHCYSATNLILEQGEVATMDGEKLTSDLGDMGGCKAQSGRCTSSDATILWDSSNVADICPFEKKGEYNGTANRNHIIIDSLQAALSIGISSRKLSIRAQRCLPETTMLTDQGIAIRLLPLNINNMTSEGRNMTLLNRNNTDIEYSNSTDFSLMADEEMQLEMMNGAEEKIVKRHTIQNINPNTSQLQTDWDTQLQRFGRVHQKQISEGVATEETEADPINAKLQYLEDKIFRQEQEAFREVWRELCHLARRQLQLVWQLLRTDPSLGARVLLERDNLHAMFAGEALMIWECREVVPDQIYWDYKIDDICYEYVPVKINDSIWFIAPGSRDLVSTSQKVSCNYHIKGIYRDQSGWSTTTGEVEVSEVPLEVIWKGHWRPFTFQAPALFHDKMAGLISTIGMMRSYGMRVLRLEAQMDHVINYTAALSVDPLAVMNTLVGAGEGMGKLAAGIGEGLGNFVKGTTTGIGELVNVLLIGPLQALLNLAVMGLCIAVMVYLLYLAVRRFLIRNTRSREEAIESIRKISDYAGSESMAARQSRDFRLWDSESQRGSLSTTSAAQRPSLPSPVRLSMQRGSVEKEEERMDLQSLTSRTFPTFSTAAVPDPPEPTEPPKEPRLKIRIDGDYAEVIE